MVKKKKPVKLAIFDIDGTIFRSSLFIELFNELVKRGIFPLKASVQVDREYQRWLNRTGHYNKYLRKMVVVFYRYIKGCTREQIESATHAVIRNQKDRVYRYTRSFIKQLRREGYFILAISNTFDIIVDHFATKMGLDASIGRVHEMRKDVYTGRTIYKGAVVTNSNLDKVDILHDFIKNHGLRTDLRHAVAVGDSEGDIALLSAVGHPIAFNPSRALADVAKKKKWPMIVERKDVMYHIKSCTLES
jgi:HAD superfamily hydrolase (TIGR01490 family)